MTRTERSAFALTAKEMAGELGEAQRDINGLLDAAENALNGYDETACEDAGLKAAMAALRRQVDSTPRRHE